MCYILKRKKNMSFLCFTKQLKPWKTNNSLNEGEKDDKEG